jgi:hypothetical protein
MVLISPLLLSVTTRFRCEQGQTDLPDGLFCNVAVQPSFKKFPALPAARNTSITLAVSFH